MNNYLNNRYRMFKKVDEVCDENSTDLYLIPNFQAEHTKLKNNNNLIEGTVQTQERETKPTTHAILEVKRELSEIMWQMECKCLPYARNADNIELTERLSFPQGYILKASMGHAITRATEIRDVIVNNLSLFVTITPQDQALMANKIQDYNDKMQLTGTELAIKKGSGTDKLPQEFRTGMKIIKNIYNMTVGEYYQTKPEVVYVIKAAMVIYDIGINHTNVILTIYEKGTKKKVKGVRALIEELNKTAISDSSGVAKFEKIKHGTFNFIFSKDGYVTTEMLIKVLQGKTIEVDVEIEKVI